MKRSILKPIAAGVTFALLIFFMPFILAGAMILMLFTFIFFRFFVARRMRRGFAASMRYSGKVDLRRENGAETEESGNRVIYLSN